MTYEEFLIAEMFVNDQIESHNSCGSTCHNEYYTLKEILESVKKYRWHNLRKDPTDIPKENGVILVYMNLWKNRHIQENDFVCIWRCDDTWYLDGYDKEEVNWKDVIYWKYLEGVDIGID